MMLLNEKKKDIILEKLINYLLEEQDEVNSLDLVQGDKENVFRSLINIRKPLPVNKEFLELQDIYLKSLCMEKVIVKLSDIPVIKGFSERSKFYNNVISLWQGDITCLEVDGIVNAANGYMLGCFIPCHNCIDNAIHSAAGVQLRTACFDYMLNKRTQDKNYVEPGGKAVVTEAYNLPCKKVLHTVGPIVDGVLTQDHKDTLEKCYRSVLEMAHESKLKTIAFCCISTGEYKFPNDIAAVIAIETISDYIEKHPNHFDRIIFNVFKDIDYSIYHKLLSKR